MILNRLAGLETEYAVRAEGEPAGPVISRILATISEITPTAHSTTVMWSSRMFCGNGGAFYHEVQHANDDAGLLEGATPECRTPIELITFQRAQERLLVQALRYAGPHNGLLKNSRDAVGNTYGVQENYDAIVARGWRLLVYRLGLAALTPLFAVGWAVTWLLLISIVALALAFAIVYGVFSLLGGPAIDTDRLISAFAFVDRFLWQGLFAIPLLGLLGMLRWLAFAEFQRSGTAYLVSRAVMSGTGAVEPDGQFHISERKSAIRGRTPLRLSAGGVFIYWFSNFAKRAISPSFFQFRYFASLFSARQRLQIGLSDSNACEEAEYLKVGTMMLVLDMAERGWLDKAPRLAHETVALERIGSDPTLTMRVETGEGAMTGLEIQRWYCERARAFLESETAISLEAWDIVQRWSDVLDKLEHEPEELVGRVDWVTKRYLLQTAAVGASDAARKKLDLRYHELETGYLAQMAAEGFVERVTDDAAIDAAIQSPPEATPATLRSRWVRDVAENELDARVDWREVRIRRGLFRRPRIVRLDDYRK